MEAHLEKASPVGVLKTKKQKNKKTNNKKHKKTLPTINNQLSPGMMKGRAPT